MNKNKTAQFFLFSGWTILSILGVILGWFWKSLPPHLPWFYSLPMGEQQLISKEFFAITLLGMSVILGLTRVIAKWAGKNDIPVETTIMGGVWISIVLVTLSYFRVMIIFAL